MPGGGDSQNLAHPVMLSHAHDVPSTRCGSGPLCSAWPPVGPTGSPQLS
ncbi:hypothetical protein VITFI_CDS2003 [Vitreoscilla filiformis]|uniref:Uncharacterized protein n=1 Tax=Vitreoscilla filiformis TaxID=63 RepID=A0A221KFI7_VITFI|nr:hypothetical protein VITFI_CDS2003 [Vitreoscilla filiformis]